MPSTFGTVAYLHIRNKKILLAKSKKHVAFYMPGGKRDGEEDDVQALIREVREELGVDIDEESIKYFGVFQAQAYAKPEGINVRITCYTGRHKGSVVANNEIDKLEYFSFEDYSKMPETAPAVHLILSDLKQKGLIK